MLSDRAIRNSWKAIVGNQECTLSHSTNWYNSSIWNIPSAFALWERYWNFWLEEVAFCLCQFLVGIFPLHLCDFSHGSILSWFWFSAVRTDPFWTYRNSAMFVCLNTSYLILSFIHLKNFSCLYLSDIQRMQGRIAVADLDFSDRMCVSLREKKVLRESLPITFSIILLEFFSCNDLCVADFVLFIYLFYIYKLVLFS